MVRQIFIQSRYYFELLKSQTLLKRKQVKIIEKKTSEIFSILTWIKGDGSVIYMMIEGIQQMENYINLLIDVFAEMNWKYWFFIPDGVSIHTSNEVIEWIIFYYGRIDGLSWNWID